MRLVACACIVAAVALAATATATAEPPDEPPGIADGSQGLRAGPKCEFSFDEPIAN